VAVGAPQIELKSAVASAPGGTRAYVEAPGTLPITHKSEHVMKLAAHTIFSMAVGFLITALSGCASTDLGPYNFPAQYRFMGEPGDYQAAPACARYRDLKIVDARANRLKVGTRYSEKGGPRYDVGMGGDIEGWLRAAATQAFAEAGIRSGGSKTVSIYLKSVVTDESVYSRASYDGSVAIEAKVGRFSTSKKGFAENYGYAGSAENYQETVNHALDKALAALVSDSGFRGALCK